MIKTLTQLTNYSIYFLPQEDYSYLTNLDIAAIAIKDNVYIDELLVTEEDYLESLDYNELQLDSKFTTIYTHSNSNLLLRFKVNNTIIDEKYKLNLRLRYYRYIIKLKVFTLLLLNYVQEKLRR